MKKSEINSYLFDFDGTLVDSMPTYVSVMLRILDENGVEYEKDIIKTITPLGYKGTAEYYKKLGVPMSVDEMVKTMKAKMFVPSHAEPVEDISELAQYNIDKVYEIPYGCYRWDLSYE